MNLLGEGRVNAASPLLSIEDPTTGFKRTLHFPLPFWYRVCYGVPLVIFMYSFPQGHRNKYMKSNRR